MIDPSMDVTHRGMLPGLLSHIPQYVEHRRILAHHPKIGRFRRSTNSCRKQILETVRCSFRSQGKSELPLSVNCRICYLTGQVVTAPAYSRRASYA